MKNKILVWETLATVSGGQKMTLAVMDMLRNEYDFCCLIPSEGKMSEELEHRNIPYVIIGDQTLPKGIKGRSVIFRYAAMSLRCIRRSLSVIRKYKPDLLYAPGPAALPWSAICGSLTGKPAVWHLHHNFQDGMTARLLNICSKWRSVKKIISVSECVGKQIENKIAADKVKVLYNPIDVNKYSSGNGTKAAEKLENEYGVITDGAVILTHIALVQRLKKQDVVLKAIKILCTWGYNIIGIFPGEVTDREYMDEIKELATELDIGNKIVFCGRRDDIPDVLAMSHAIIIPSFEGFPLAAQEAAAAGIPVIAADLGGAAEFVSLTGAGEVFREDDPESMADKIIAVLENREVYTSNGKNYSVNWSESKYRDDLRGVFGECTGK